MIENRILFIVLVIAFEGNVAYDHVALWPQVQLPVSYIAMKGDIVVSYSLNDTYFYKSIKSVQDRYMIHLEYLPGDAVLTNSHPKDSSTHLASLPIPIGVTKGSVVFNCGTITRAGPHRAILTVNGLIEAVSPVLQVGWPPVSLRVPAALETYATDVNIVIAFTTTICTPLMGENSGSLHPNSVLRSSDVFQSSLVLVECSKSLISHGSCQIPTKRNDPRIWYWHDLSHYIYQKSSFEVKLNCSLWGQEGIFRVFLTSDLSHAAVIERSGPIRVTTSEMYHLESFFSFVPPCHENEVMPINVRLPKCAGMDDKIRVYGQGHRVVNGNFLSQQWKRYLGEVRINRNDKIAVFPCETFVYENTNHNNNNNEKVQQFCFHYVARSILGTTNTTFVFCMPASDQDFAVVQASWSPWSVWSQCQVNAGNCGRGMRSRHRFCQNSHNQPMLICQGKPVEYQTCHGPPCNVLQPQEAHKGHANTQFSKWRPLAPIEASSPCACGCIYVVNNERKVDITSGEECPTLPILWTVQASGARWTKFRLLLVTFSCDNSILNVRKRDKEEDDDSSMKEVMVYQTERDLNTVEANDTNVIEVTTSHSISLQFHAPRRSCRINIGSVAIAIEEPDTTAFKTSPTSSISANEKMELLDAFFEHLPWILIVTLAFVLVTCISGICMVFQFEYRRKKYLAWKNLPGNATNSINGSGGIHTSSTGSTPSSTKHVRWKNADENIIETSCEFLLHDDITPSPGKLRQNMVKKRLKMASNLLKRHFMHRGGGLHGLSRGRKRLRRSLSESNVMMSSFLLPISASEEMASPLLVTSVAPMNTKNITACHVKRALRAKSQRYRSGHFRRLNRPRTPWSTPLLGSKRSSRSLSDIAALLSPELVLVVDPPCHPLPFTKVRNVAVKDLNSGSEASHSVQFESSKQDLRQKRRRRLDRTTAEKLSFRRNQRLLHSSSTASTISGSNGSISTLKATTTSLSEFSEHSYHSGDPELEYDLYDCDLNNVSAVPGSLFAPKLYYDLTPTGDENDEEFELTELFPMLRPDASNHPRKQTGSNGGQQMVNSLTSDLTASVTSEDLTQRDSVYYNSDNLEDSVYYCYNGEGTTENDHLLRSKNSIPPSSRLKRPQLLNLTHIDDISFADE